MTRNNDNTVKRTARLSSHCIKQILHINSDLAQSRSRTEKSKIRGLAIFSLLREQKGSPFRAPYGTV